ncbi:hypothetical protein OKA05_12395 [Luteolibacter arcticus]|uniref:Uncharacterized protein n=1 Tax=Luteolibacter arcticus TaxID=1581411 RepID=A0ABT3GIP2_9BACT|nr:hypothetical protein [Luteolibacter arcticus]MCW1923356.1 hypothetical protein [Luteolibacter arcticus]
MKRLILTTCLLLLSHLAAASPATDLKGAANDAMKEFFSNLNTFGTSQVWNDFSSVSKERYRVVFLEDLAAGRQGLQSNLLRDRGFFEPLEEVRGMRNQEFWDRWISDQAAREKNTKPALWRDQDATIPKFSVVTVAREESRVYIVVEIEEGGSPVVGPGSLHQSLFDPSMRHMTTKLPESDLKLIEGAKFLHLYTAVIDGERIRLDIPKDVFFRASLRRMKPER